MLAALHVLAALGGKDQPLSELVDDVPAALDRIRAWALRNHSAVDDLDGLTVCLPDGSWFNVRPSNTEPLLRLKVEASTQSAMTALWDIVLAVIRR